MSIKRKVVIFVSLLCAAAIGHAQQTGKGGDSTKVLTLNQQSIEAQLKKDVALLDKLLATDAVIVNGNGTLSTRDVLLQDLKSGKRVFSTYTLDEAKVSMHGGTAVVWGMANAAGTFAGGPFMGKYLYTKVFVKEKGDWKIVSWQSTSVPQAVPVLPGRR